VRNGLEGQKGRPGVVDKLSSINIDVAVSAIGSRNFVSFEELATALEVSVDTVIANKSELEAAIRRDDNRLRLTSRVDLVPPGFEVED
jgi:hypothetical protein